MKRILLSLTFLTLLLPGAATVAGGNGGVIIGKLRLGMTEAEVNEHYPEGKMSMDGIKATIQGRYGDFRRGEETYMGGLTMFKIQPEGLDSKAACQSFFDALRPELTGQYGDPASESSNDQGTVTASQAAWQGPGLSIRLEAVWYGDQSTCSAELFVRPTDIQPL